VRAILIAAKQLALAKTRLAPALPSASERQALARAMYCDVLAAALGAQRPEMVAVVTSDATLLDLAGSVGAMTIDEEFPRGLNVAVRLATTVLIDRGATTICTVLSDIPLVASEDIDAAFAALPAAGNGVVLVPSRDCSGTNLIVRRPPDIIATRFGSQSLARHREDCRALGLECAVVRMARPALDIDLAGDLIEFARSPSMTHTFSHLARLGMAHG
jgi:2-phospho-L-lactate/phosphoenolpyruvate guanylyltransferase